MPKPIKEDFFSSGELFSNKVFQTLKCLSHSERKKLEKFMRSPYFVQSKTLTSLNEILCKYIDLNLDGFDRYVVWAKLFPATKYDDVNFRKYCSELLKSIQDFMAHEHLEMDETQKTLNATGFITRRKISPLYKSIIKEVQSQLNSISDRSLKYHHAAYQFERYFYTMNEFDVQVDAKANIENISINLDMFYWIEKLKLGSAALSQKKTGNHDYKIHFIDEIRTYLENYDIESNPELAIYYYSFLTLHDPEDTKNYDNLKRLLTKIGGILSKSELIELTDSALHYCTGRMNKGNRHFLQEYFDLFVDALNQDLFIEEKLLATWRFNNMVGVALRLGRLEWVENFIEKYHIFLPADQKRNTYTFNLARVYRFQGKYNKVLELLQNVEYEDTGYNLISKAMLTITYFELNETDTLFSFLTSFKAYLTRHKEISKPRRQGYLNLIKYTRRLIRLDFSDAAAVARLREEITREKASTINHEWLLEKLSGTSR